MENKESNDDSKDYHVSDMPLNQTVLDSRTNRGIANSIEELNELIYTMKSKVIPRHELLLILHKVVENLQSLVDFSRISEEIVEDEEETLIPLEVQEWIQATFMQDNEKTSKRKAAYVNKISIVIKNDAEFIKFGNEIPKPALKMLKKDKLWEFNIFKFHDASEDHGLKYALFYYLDLYKLFHHFKIPIKTFNCLMNHVEYGYERYNNPYHNSRHATDVLQSAHALLTLTGMVTRLSPLELFATLTAAAIHDYDHQGVTNAFIVNNKYHLSLTYNDISVLENHHLSAFFKLLRNPNVNITSNLTKEQFNEFRDLCIKMVLATDMSRHFTKHKHFTNQIQNNERIEIVDYLSNLIHTADLSNPTKEWNIALRWVVYVFYEFFAQGDKEKTLGVPVSPLCDRNSTLISQSQIGFIDFIVQPTFELFSKLTETYFGQERSKKPKEIHHKKKMNGFHMKIQYTYCVKRPWEVTIMQNRASWRRQGDTDYQELKLNLENHYTEFSEDSCIANSQ